MRKQIKRLTALLLCVVLAFSLIACEETTSSIETEDQGESETLTDTSDIDITTDTDVNTDSEDESQTETLIQTDTEESETDSQTEIAIDDYTESSTVTETESETDEPTESVTETESENETEAVTETESATETVTETETEKETKTETVTESETKVQSESETETVSETEIQSQTESEIETNTEEETPADTDSDSETETVSDTASETVTEIQSETETEIDMETESSTETVIQTESTIESETVTESETLTASETVTESETEPETFIPSEGAIKIYIDQGHNPGSFNTGASGNGLKEEELTYEIGVLLAQMFEGDERYEICLSRPTADTVLGTDNSSSLAARVEGAEAFGAHLVVSLHINAFTSESANGIEVLVYSEESSGYELGTYLLDGLLEATSLRNRGMKERPDLHILKNSKVPTALVEMGFITNPTEAALLDNSPEIFAQGVYNGIINYVAKLES